MKIALSVLRNGAIGLNAASRAHPLLKDIEMGKVILQWKTLKLSATGNSLTFSELGQYLF
jgi:hypothetical protein